MFNSALNVSRALLVSLAGCIALCGCTREVQVQDLAIANVSVTNSDEWDFPDPELLPEPLANLLPKDDRRSLLRVDLATKADLIYMSWDWHMINGAVPVFCYHPDDNVLLDFGTYASADRAGGPPRSLGRPFLRPSNGPRPVVERADPAEKQTYYLLLNIAVPPSPNSGPPEVGFGLLHNPEDICISLRGEDLQILGPPSHRLRSNTVRLSREAIRETLGKGPVGP
jgi:hypothetical protein